MTTEDQLDFAAREIQSQYSEIYSTQQTIAEKQRTLNSRAQLLERRVLNHFNNFLTDKVNSVLTKGKVLPAEKAQYESDSTGHPRGYVITTGAIQYPNGKISDDPFEQWLELANKCNE